MECESEDLSTLFATCNVERLGRYILTQGDYVNTLFSHNEHHGVLHLYAQKTC